MNEELKVIISAEIKKLKENVDKAKKTIKDFVKDNKEKIQEFNEEFQKIGDGSKKVLTGVAGGVAAAATAFLALGPATEEYRNAQAKLNTAFESAGSNAAVAKETYNDLYRVLGDGDVAVEAANHLAKLTTNEQDLSEWTTICQGIYATFGDSLPIEGLTEAANETAKVGQLTGGLADALNWAGVSEDAFNEKLAACNNEAEREKLIRETLSGLYNDAAANYEENASAILEQNEAQEALNAAMAELGEVAAPINTMLSELGAEILADLTPYIKEFAEKYMPDIKEALSGVGEKIGEVISFIADNWETISTIAAVILGICAALSVFSTVMGVVNAVMYASPVTWIVLAIVAAIAALVAIIVVCVKHWDEIKAAVVNAAEKIRNVVDKINEAIVGFFKKMFEGIKNAVTNIKNAVSEKFQNIKDSISEKVSAAKEAVSEKFGQIRDKMRDTMENAKNAVKEKLSKMKQTYDEHGGGIKGVVAASMENIKEKYQAGYDFLNKITKGKFGDMVESMRSKMQAARDAVSNVLGKIKEKFSNIFENVKNTVRNAIDKLKSFFKFDWKLPKLKLPRVSITGKFSLSPLQVPKFSIKWNALGGVFDKPAIFSYGNTLQGIGENGAEAVVPLENNLGWLDKLAGMLNDRIGTNKNIVLQVDGKTFAQISCDSINQLTRQRGSIPLNLI